MRKLRHKLSVALVIGLMPLHAMAGNFACSGKVTTVAISPSSGLLTVAAGSGIHYICKVNVEYNGVHPETCKALYSMALTVKASGKQLRQHYTAIPGVVENCSQLGTWQTPPAKSYYTDIID